MNGSQLREVAAELAVEILDICEITKKKHYELSERLENSVVEIGVSLHAANNALDKYGRLSDLKRAMHACFETECRLEVFIKSEVADKELLLELYGTCAHIRKTLALLIQEQDRNI